AGDGLVDQVDVRRRSGGEQGGGAVAVVLLVVVRVQVEVPSTHLPAATDAEPGADPGADLTVVVERGNRARSGAVVGGIDDGVVVRPAARQDVQGLGKAVQAGVAFLF